LCKEQASEPAEPSQCKSKHFLPLALPFFFFCFFSDWSVNYCFVESGVMMMINGSELEGQALGQDGSVQLTILVFAAVLILVVAFV
jgi:hypothetical protein